MKHLELTNKTDHPKIFRFTTNEYPEMVIFLEIIYSTQEDYIQEEQIEISLHISGIDTSELGGACVNGVLVYVSPFHVSHTRHQSKCAKFFMRKRLENVKHAQCFSLTIQI